MSFTENQIKRSLTIGMINAFLSKYAPKTISNSNIQSKLSNLILSIIEWGTGKTDYSEELIINIHWLFLTKESFRKKIFKGNKEEADEYLDINKYLRECCSRIHITIAYSG